MQKELEGTGMSPSIRSIISSYPANDTACANENGWAACVFLRQRSLGLHAAILGMHDRRLRKPYMFWSFDNETILTKKHGSQAHHLNFPRCAAGKWKGRIVSEL